jgi:peptidyl-dipeptidase Dcp
MDFVELPSQVMERCYEPEALALFATHYQTENNPDGICKKIKESASFQEGLATMRQLSFGLLDMGWHQDPTAITDVKTLKLGNSQPHNCILK